ncbi:hypothetical protein FACS189425_07930 [Clostridia bacterium]|nr:hypothetical protein FACS189425_07930 [Clostridia bacterium]
MSVILGIDTSTSILDCAILRDGVVLVEGHSDEARTHSERCLPMVIELLEKAGMEPADVDIFAATVGPGSYTGLRIGVATARALAYGSGARAMGISTLELMQKGEATPVIDARNGAVFALVDGEHKRVSLEEMEGRELVYPFAGKWSGICEADLRDLDDMDMIYLGGSV